MTDIQKQYDEFMRLDAKHELLCQLTLKDRSQANIVAWIESSADIGDAATSLIKLLWEGLEKANKYKEIALQGVKLARDVLEENGRYAESANAERIYNELKNQKDAKDL